MGPRQRGLRLGAVVAVGALALAACGSDSSGDDATPSAAPGGTYSIGLRTPEYFTPSNCYDLYCANILQAVFTGLYEFESEGASMKTVPTPLLKSVTTDDGGKTYVIEINSGNSFTNGEAVTAQTFVDTWNYAANTGNGQQLGFVFGPSQLNVEGYADVEAPDSTDGTMSGLQATSETTIEVTLAAPIGKPLFENYLAGPQIPPMPSVAIEDPAEFEKNPIGNGPYMLKEPWETTGVTLVRNADYSYEAGMADEIEFRFYANENSLWADLQANNLDVAQYLPTTALAQAETVLGDRYINSPGMTFSYEAYPTQVDAFKSRDVRVALAKAVDWNEIGEKVHFGTRSVATSFAPPSVPGGGLDVCGDDCTYDPVAAKALLDDAGGIPGNKVFIGGVAESDNLLQKAECNFIQESLGVTCEVKVFEGFGDQLKAFNNLGADDEGLIIQLGWGADNPTLANMIAPLFATGSASNYTAYSNAEFDRLIEEGNQASDEATAIAKWQEAEKALYEDFAGHATQWRSYIGGYSENVSNVKVNAGGFWNVTETTVNSAS